MLYSEGVHIRVLPDIPTRVDAYKSVLFTKDYFCLENNEQLVDFGFTLYSSLTS